MKFKTALNIYSLYTFTIIIISFNQLSIIFIFLMQIPKLFQDVYFLNV